MNKKNRGEAFEEIVIIIFIISALIVLARACSQQSITRNWGGEMDMHLEPNRKLVEVTWKNDNIWYLTKPMTDDDIAEVYEFAESDAIGVFEGTLHIYETKINENGQDYKDYLKWREANGTSNYQDYLNYLDYEDQDYDTSE